uniref:Uncharacterized protein n=1 Tax=viral metagenome TaxID=1070528 RepID=A0A6C0KKQ1_9ZZZZ
MPGMKFLFQQPSEISTQITQISFGIPDYIPTRIQ